MTTVSPRAQLAPPYCLSPPTDELPPFLNDVPEQEEMFVKEESEQVINFFAVAEEGDGGSSPGVKDEPSSSPDDTDSTKAKSEKDEVEDEVKDDDTKANHNKYCHFCQHIKVKRASSMLACENRGCNRRFCEHCLTTHLHDARSSQEWRRKGAAWHCPICTKSCCCTMRECTKAHRHCKAYRYRRKRAQQAEVDKLVPEPAGRMAFFRPPPHAYPPLAHVPPHLHFMHYPAFNCGMPPPAMHHPHAQFHPAAAGRLLR